jgi:hypothetical protein
VVCFHRLVELVLPLACPTEVGMVSPQNAPSESFAHRLLVPATSTPLGADYLVEGIVVVILGSPWRSSR